MFLLKVSIPSLSHTHYNWRSDDHIMEKRIKGSEKWAAGGMQGMGRGKEDFHKWVTDKTDALSYCSSVPWPHCHSCSLFLLSALPQGSRRLWDLLCSNCRAEMGIFWKQTNKTPTTKQNKKKQNPKFFQANSWLCLHGKINSSCSVYGKKMPTVQ